MFAFVLYTLLTHFLSCITALTAFEITRIPPEFVYWLFQSFYYLSFLRRNRALNRNGHLKAALFHVFLFVTNHALLHYTVHENKSTLKNTTKLYLVNKRRLRIDAGTQMPIFK